MPLFPLFPHSNCRETEIALRSRMSDLVIDYNRLRSEFLEFQEAARAREQELMDRERDLYGRLLTLTNPTAYRTLYGSAPAPAPPVVGREAADQFPGRVVSTGAAPPLSSAPRPVARVQTPAARPPVIPRPRPVVAIPQDPADTDPDLEVQPLEPDPERP